MHSIAVIGAGYWGPNLIRNFRANPAWDLVAVCDLDEARARKVVGARSTVDIETSVERLLARDDIDAVAIATPAKTHAPLALAAFQAGKHVLVEKPLADNAETAAVMVSAAEAAGKVLMIDHTFCYTPAVQYIRDTIASGELGDVLYIDSTRINLGLVQPDVDVFWDLAPHDLSILDFILPGGLAADRRHRARRRPARGRQGLRRLPEPAPRQRGDRARQRQLALPPPRSVRWSSAAAAGPWCGTT